jgi:phage-related protein
MALETFAPAQNPNVGLGVRKQPDVLVAPFGDGYQQRTPNGLNANRRVVNLAWDPVSPEIAAYIDDFFDRHQSSRPFWWINPRDPVLRKWTCPEWERTEPQWNASAITATLVEDFGLES